MDRKFSAFESAIRSCRPVPRIPRVCGVRLAVGLLRPFDPLAVAAHLKIDALMGYVVRAANQKAQERRIAGQRELGRGERPRPGIGELQQASDEAVAVLSERILEPLPVVADSRLSANRSEGISASRVRLQNGWPAKALPVWVQPPKALSSKSQVGVCAQAQDAATKASAAILILSEISI